MATTRRKTAAPPSARQLFQAGIKKRPVTTVEDIFQFADPNDREARGPDDHGSISHTTMPKVTMWKPNPPFGWTPREVPVANIGMLLDNGWAPRCPDCGTADCTSDPNSCSGRSPLAYRECPVCNKKVFDNVAFESDLNADDEEPDPNKIADDAYITATPASRTKARLDRHMLGFHPEEAAARGLIPQTPRDPTDMVTRR